MTKGLAAFVLPLQSNMIFSIIDPLSLLEANGFLNGHDVQLFQYFGLEDSVYNHLKLLIDLNNGVEIDASKFNENLLNKRHFSV